MVALDTRTLNRAVLSRQLLLARSRLGPARVLERIGGIQAQYAPSSYVGLWSRMEGLTRDRLTKALHRRRVVHGTLMRATIHLVSAADYPLLAAGVRSARRDWWLRVADRGLDGAGYERLAGVLAARLGDGTAKRAELIEAMLEAGYRQEQFEGAGLWIDMVRAPPGGTWDRRRADVYALASAWLGGRPVSERAGLELLIRRYLGGFGPAAGADLADWAGVPISTLYPVLEAMRLRSFRDVEGRELLDLPRRPIPDPATPAPVRFLPTWDATLLANVRRAAILPEDYRPVVFSTKNPHSVPTFLVDGAVAGTWRWEGGRVAVQPFDPLPTAVRREVDEEAARLATLHSD